MHLKKIVLFFSFLPLLAACGGTASATLAFSNVSRALDDLKEKNLPMDFFLRADRYTTEAATEFKIKLIAAYLSEDIAGDQSNSGTTSFVYLNPDCNDDIMHCDISAGTAEDGNPMSEIVTSYFDFGQTSSAVNAALNAQAREIEAASYKYVRLEFCKYNSGNAENIQWNGNAVGTQSFQRNQCTVNSAQVSPPLEILAGSTVTVTLTYDYSTSIQVGADATGDDCEGVGAGKTCFTLPSLTPSAS